MNYSQSRKKQQSKIQEGSRSRGLADQASESRQKPIKVEEESGENGIERRSRSASKESASGWAEGTRPPTYLISHADGALPPTPFQHFSTSQNTFKVVPPKYPLAEAAPRYYMSPVSASFVTPSSILGQSRDCPPCHPGMRAGFFFSSLRFVC